MVSWKEPDLHLFGHFHQLHGCASYTTCVFLETPKLFVHVRNAHV